MLSNSNACTPTSSKRAVLVGFTPTAGTTEPSVLSAPTSKSAAVGACSDERQSGGSGAELLVSAPVTKSTVVEGLQL
jgi:hypothetical protein